MELRIGYLPYETPEAPNLAPFRPLVNDCDNGEKSTLGK